MCCPNNVFRAVLLDNLNETECAAVGAKYSTLLGTDPTFGCYWEWVWQNLGSEAYMHRPTRWGMLQFADVPAADAVAAPPCLNVEFPGRHVAEQLYTAQRHYQSKHNAFATDVADLAAKAYCTGLGCDLAALKMALATPDVFTVGVTVEANATKLSRSCTRRPCFLASVEVAVPGTDHTYEVMVNENQRTLVTHGTGNLAGCL